MREASTPDAGFAAAVRALLERPFLTRSDDIWPAIVANDTALVEYFEETCGWALTVDARRGHARLHKRRVEPDPTRSLRRDNGTPMRRGGYAMLALVAAELVSRPTTTVGDLADNLATAALADTTLPAFDPTVHAHRLAFVDALRWYVTNSFAQITAGDLDRYHGGTGDAVIAADPARFSELLATSTPPSRVPAGTTDDWVAALSAEPRYQLVEDGRGDSDAVNRHSRHQLGRALLDDPGVIIEDLDDNARRYLASGPGRARLRDATERAGFIYEESSDVIVAVDPSAEATDRTFGRSVDTITQVAIAILDEITPNRDSTDAVSVDTIEAFVDTLLGQDPDWAASYQKPGGAQLLAREALETLAAFTLTTPAPTTPAATFESDPGTAAATGTLAVRPTPLAGRFVTTVIDSRTGFTEETP